MNDNVLSLKVLLTAAMQHSEADSSDAAFALAQMLGIVAAKLDQHNGFVPFEERWKDITEVARAEYHKVHLQVRRPILADQL